jgi:serine/threonine protein kinase
LVRVRSVVVVLPSPPVPSSPPLGSLLGPWLLVERHDEGSYGAVYRVQRAGHPEAGHFALKLARYPEDWRFAREVKLLQLVVHSSVPRFEDRGWWTGPEGDRFPYIVMEWIQGVPLYEWARQQKPTSLQVLRVLEQLAGALAATHAAGAMHRDVKGDNVRVCPSGRAVLLDFGCGTYAGAKVLTDSSLPPGTTIYRTPEALRWHWAHWKEGTPYQACAADDVYALGVTAYRLCTGTYPPQPTESGGPTRRFVPPRELATVSAGLEQQLLAALTADRLARPPAAALAAALSAAAKEPDAVRPIVPTPAAATTESGAPPQSSRRPPKPRRWSVPAWLSTASIALAGGLIAGLVLLLSERLLFHWSLEPTASVEEVHTVPMPEVPDGGVGEEALASMQDFPRVGVPTYSLGVPMPKSPLPGQRRPPCEARVEKAINGACWVVVGDEKSPCGSRMFDYEERCYVPSFDAPRQPTSEEHR